MFSGNAGSDADSRRARMVEAQLVSRGIRDAAVLEAMRRVPRELFITEGMREFAYEDTALPIEAGQTISQPYMVALMAAALELQPSDRVLEIGTGSGYAAAVLAEIADEVYTIERHAELAAIAEQRLNVAGYRNVHVRVSDGTQGWSKAAPFDAIVVAAGGPRVPEPLKCQLAVGGRLVIPVGETPRSQELLRLTRRSEERFHVESLGPVRFVPLVGTEGWDETGSSAAVRKDLSLLIRESAQAFGSIETADLDDLVDRLGQARVVLLGEATHGTHEFYEMRARISRELIERKGFRIVALEADWPDASRVSAYVGAEPREIKPWQPFDRFPTWMWRNREFGSFIEWLRAFNADRGREDRVSVNGLDLYSLYTSIDEVLAYLDRVDPDAAAVARHRYGCLEPWEAEPSNYGRAAITGGYRSCEDEVVAALGQLLERRMGEVGKTDHALLDAIHNARLVTNAERYYRIMYYGSTESWNLRDRHMAATLQMLLEYGGPSAKAIVWAHNSHVGDASATEMGAGGQLNVGQLARERWGEAAHLVGFGTHTGTVAAASAWGGPLEIKDVVPSRPGSYERTMHESGVSAFHMHLREPRNDELRARLLEPQLERAIGVVYRPDAELQSHYFQASLARQFDEYVWFGRSRAVSAYGRAPSPHHPEDVPETYPFGL